MSVKNIIRLLTLLFCSCSVSAQRSVLGKVVNIGANLGKPYPYEFSSMAKWINGRDTAILLIPALKEQRRSDYQIYACSPTDIRANLNHRRDTVRYRPIKIDAHSFNRYRSSIAGYDGIEGTAISGNDIFFMVECKTDTCYLLKGHFSISDQPIIVIDDAIKIGKPFKNSPSNLGYEAFTSYKNSLLAIFEKGADNQSFYIDANTKTITNGSLPQVLPVNYRNWRISESCVYNDTLLLIRGAVNHCAEIVKVTNSDVIPIATLRVRKWGCDIGDPANWEGMTTFDKGVLIVNDNQWRKGPVNSNLYYFELWP